MYARSCGVLNKCCSVIFRKDFYCNPAICLLPRCYSGNKSQWDCHHSSAHSLNLRLCGSALVIGGLFLGFNWNKNTFFNVLPIVHASVADTSGGRRAQFNFIADVVEKSANAVVYIEIIDSRRFDYFTGVPRTISNGSGFIVKEDGLILTNAHVVNIRPSAIVQVRLYDGSTHKGVVEDIDVKSDLATIRIHSKQKLPVMKLGSSRELRPGEFVVAMGSPLSLSNTITSGVISTVHRSSHELGLHGREMVYIQTDASITFGNSGGPLVNLDGEAIGINSMKVTSGISFAIPIDYAKDFLRRSEERRKGIPLTGDPLMNPKRYMGITMLTLTPELILEMQAHKRFIPTNIDHGVLVWKVVVGSPAYNGGLQPGDIITLVNGKAVINTHSVYTILETTEALNMVVIRNGAKHNITVHPELR